MSAGHWNRGVGTSNMQWEMLLSFTENTLHSHLFLVCLQQKIKVQLWRSERRPGERLICCRDKPHAVTGVTHWDYMSPPSSFTLKPLRCCLPVFMWMASVLFSTDNEQNPKSKKSCDCCPRPLFCWNRGREDLWGFQAPQEQRAIQDPLVMLDQWGQRWSLHMHSLLRFYRKSRQTVTHQHI